MSSGKSLVLAEKPSVGRDLARILSIPVGRGRDYLENDRYVVSWMIGHLLGYAFPGEQNPAWQAWSFSTLPLFPEKFMLKEISSTSRQLQVLKGLFSRTDISEIIVATDAAREGELIFRHVYNYFESGLPFRRLWIQDNTDTGIRKAFAALQPGHKYDNLAASARARSQADWLVGMNFSRAYSLKANGRFSIGRVQTPVLALLVDRRKAIDNFVPVPFFVGFATVSCRNGEEFQARMMCPPEYKQERFDTEDQARLQARKIQGKTGRVQQVSRKDTVIPAPLLYDLTALQKEANARYGYSARQTLEYAQKLYEAEKVITYPRTDSKYITKEIFRELDTRINALPSGYMPLIRLARQNLEQNSNFKCVNDKKVTDHYAVIPTDKTPSSDLSQDLKLIYNLVARRFLAAFMPAARVQNTRMTINVEKEELQVSGKIFKVTGWIEAEPWRKSSDVILPDIKKNEKVQIGDVEIRQSKTKAPPHFTEKTLLAAMESGDFRLHEDQGDDHLMGLVDQSRSVPTVGLGRPSTRDSMIELLISRGYAQRNKKQIIATDTGVRLIDFVQDTLPPLCSAKVTHVWEETLENIARGRERADIFIDRIKTFIAEGITVMRAQKEQAFAGPAHELTRENMVGNCPLCGRPVYLKFKGKAYSCINNNRRENPDCPFVFFPRMFGGSITRPLARELLEKGVTSGKVSLRTKAGKEFQARYQLVNGRISLLFD
ncbi:MAG: DNA topoisomerase III [Desulfonatronovibrio sp.]